MDFTLNDEQRMLCDLVERFVDKDYSFEARKASIAAPGGFCAQRWQTLAECGLLGLNVPEDSGGLGGSPEDTMVVMEALGRGLVVEPFAHHGVVVARLIAALASAAQKEQWLPALAVGSEIATLACLEPAGGFDLWHVDTRAVPSGGAWVIDGAKCTVPFGDGADFLLVSARTSGGVEEKEGISLFRVARDAPGMQVTGFVGFDGHRVAEVRLQGVRVDGQALVGPVGQAYAGIEQAVDHGIAALCAESVGAMQKLLDLTAEYLRSRKQFGKLLGSFQALQHKAADMVVSVEQARSAALMATANLDRDPITRRRSVSAAKWLVGRCGRHVGETATQLHGGMGMTDEMPSGHYFKRLIGIDKTWGDSEHHSELFSQAMAN